MKNVILANKELNEWCGTEGINYYSGIKALGFLFLHAVPKVRYISLVKPDGKSTYSASARNGVGIVGDVGYCFGNEDPADTVFWAIHKVMKGVKDE